MQSWKTLAETTLFAGLGDAARTELRHAVERQFDRGATLWRQGDRPRGLFVLVEGKVRILGVRGDRQFVVHTAEAGDTIGEVPLFASGVYPATAVAATNLRCVIVDRARLRAAMAAEPQLAWRLLGRLARRVAQLVNRLEGWAGATVRSRLAAHLLALLARADGGEVTLDGSQSELAEELGTVREVVAREIAHLREQGIVESLPDRVLRILDELALERLVEEPRPANATVAANDAERPCC